MTEQTNPPETYDHTREFYEALAGEIRDFLGPLAKNPDDLAAYVDDRVAFLQRSGLSTFAQDLLLESDFSRVQAVMSAGSKPQRWLVIWIV